MTEGIFGSRVSPHWIAQPIESSLIQDDLASEKTLQHQQAACWVWEAPRSSRDSCSVDASTLSGL
jgi:hypothetical protein